MYTFIKTRHYYDFSSGQESTALLKGLVHAAVARKTRDSSSIFFTTVARSAQDSGTNIPTDVLLGASRAQSQLDEGIPLVSMFFVAEIHLPACQTVLVVAVQ